MEIRAINTGDKEALIQFFTDTITHTFKNNGVEDDEDLQNEIDTKLFYINRHFSSADYLFYVAIIDNEIVGTIACYPTNENINKLTNYSLDHLVEMGTLYVHPDQQGKGIGSQLIEYMLSELRTRGIQQVCFDCGYRKAMETWTKKFGPPTYFYENYWDEDDHHAIWVLDL